MRTLLVVSFVTLLGSVSYAEQKHVSLSKDEAVKRLDSFWEHLAGGKKTHVVFYGTDSNKPLDKWRFEDFQCAIHDVVVCAECNQVVLSNEAICERLQKFWQHLSDDRINTVIFCEETPNIPDLKVKFEDLEYSIYDTAGCCYPLSRSLAKEWTEYTWLDCIWKSLQNENVREIAFCRIEILTDDKKPPEEWQCEKIVEPNKIKEVVNLLGKALGDSNDRFANEKGMDTKCGCFMTMKIVTDKHKFLIPLNYYEYWKPHEAIRGIGWTSYELMEKLKQWYPEKTPRPTRSTLPKRH